MIKAEAKGSPARGTLARKGPETKQAVESAVHGIARDVTRSLTSRDRIGLPRAMVLGRVAEQRARTLAGREDDAEPAAGWHREPIGAGAAAVLRPGDRLIAPGAQSGPVPEGARRLALNNRASHPQGGSQARKFLHSNGAFEHLDAPVRRANLAAGAADAADSKPLASTS